MKKCSSMQIDVWGQAVKVSFTACPRFSASACQFYGLSDFHPSRLAVSEVRHAVQGGYGQLLCVGKQ